MNKLIVTALLTLGMAGAAQAEGPLAGDPVAGQGKTALCSACHNPDGNSLAPNFPKLAGQGQRYLLKQLHDIKAGQRPVLEMTGMLDGLNDQDLADIAAWYASQQASVGAAQADLVERGRALYNGGDLSKGLPACTGCHAPNGQGIALASFPHLGGQHASYTAKQLTAFREGERSNDGDAMVMRSIASKLSNKDIEAVSSYIEGLH